MSTITVSLPAHLRELVESKVRSGLYGNISEVVREALRQWEAGDQTEDPELEALIVAGLQGSKVAWNKTTIDSIRKNAKPAKRKK